MRKNRRNGRPLCPEHHNGCAYPLMRQEGRPGDLYGLSYDGGGSYQGAFALRFCSVPAPACVCVCVLLRVARLRRERTCGPKSFSSID